MDVIYTDVWVSMGEPDEVWTERIKELSPYQVNKAVMDNAGEQAIFMHCLPAFHDLKTKKYLNPDSLWYLKRQKIVCIQSRQ